jgi:hypothetical protein
MFTYVLWSLAGAVLVMLGWLASAWHHGRKLEALQRHLKAVKQTHAEHGEQMKRQIGQLQAALATHRTAVPSAPPAPAARTARTTHDAPGSPRPAAGHDLRHGGGFPPTVVVSAPVLAAAGAANAPRVPVEAFPPTMVVAQGFAATEVMH